MYIYIAEQPVTPDMIGVDMGSEDRDRKRSQPPGYFRDIADAEPRINQDSLLLSEQQEGMDLLPVPVFADGKGLPVYTLHRKPKMI
ncbi:hypothetical protein D3C80_1642980 [compost metagenome]